VVPSTRAFYDRLAADYHLIYEDWPAAVRRQAAALDRLIRGELGTAAGDLLDCACGIGTQALGLAELGYRVSAIDLSREAIARATREAQARGLELAFRVADMRALQRAVPGRFDVVLAADNALPHLLTDQDLAAALQAIARKLRPHGLFLASIRDYDAALVSRPETWPARLLGEEGQRRIVQQVWEWLDQRRYRVHIFITRQSARGWCCDHHVALYRALTRSELSAAIEAAGLGPVRWLMPEQSGFHQPLVLARTGGAQDGAVCPPAAGG
jgi:glycine/sarcosine N-methyltransferase